MTERNTLGIDLGTLNLRAVYLSDLQASQMQIEDENSIPSKVAFANNSILTGLTAEMQQISNAKNTIYAFRGFLGRNYSDTFVQQEIDKVPYTVEEQDGEVRFNVSYQGEQVRKSPEEIMALMLAKLIAHSSQEQKVVDKVVIAVPHHFDEAQRSAVRKAAELAKIKDVKFITEPLAAAMAFDLRKSQTKKNTIVCDFGGESFDVSLLTVVNNEFVVRKSSSVRLEDLDFDNVLAEYVLGAFRRRVDANFTIKSQEAKLLNFKCREAKHFLSENSQTRIQIKKFFYNHDLDIKITQVDFDNVIQSTVERCLEAVEKLLADEGLDKEEIGDILLVGGNARIPRIRHDLEIFFDKPIKINNSSESQVARGAAIYAYSLMNTGKNDTNLSYSDVVILSLGIELDNGKMKKVIEHNTPVPVEKSIELTTAFDYHTSIDLRVYQGERPFAKDNKLLEKLMLDNLQIRKAGAIKINVKFTVGKDGLLIVTVSAENVKRQLMVPGVTNSSTTIPISEFNKILLDSEQNREQDQLRLRICDRKCEYEQRLKELESTLSSKEGEQRKSTAIAICKHLRWIKSYQGNDIDQINQHYQALNTYFII